MELHREYATFGRQVGYSAAAYTIGALLAFIRLPILTKGLGPSLYGIWSLINVALLLIVPFALLGFNWSIVRFLAAEKDKGKIREDFLSALFLVFISGIGFSILLFLFSDFLAISIFKDIDSSFYIKLASILLLLNSITMFAFSFFRAFRQIGLYAVITILHDIFQLGLVILFIQLGFKLTGVIVAFIISQILFSLISLLIILRRTGFQLPRLSRMKSYMRYGIPLTPTAALGWITTVSDRYIISYFMGVTAVGIYSAAYALGGYASFLLTPVGIVLFPTIIKAYERENLGEVRKYLEHSLKYFMMITIPSVFGISILAKPVLELLTTPEFVPGSIVVVFIAFSTIALSFTRITNNILHAAKKVRLITGLSGITAAINIVLNIILIPPMGIVGAAIATLIALSVRSLVMLLITRRYLKFDLSGTFILKSVFSSGIMALCLWLINPQSIVLIIISIFAGAAIYFSVLLLIRSLSKEELAFFSNLVKDSLRKARVLK